MNNKLTTASRGSMSSRPRITANPPAWKRQAFSRGHCPNPAASKSSYGVDLATYSSDFRGNQTRKFHHVYLRQCIYELVWGRQLPNNIVNLIFKLVVVNNKLTNLWGSWLSKTFWSIHSVRYVWRACRGSWRALAFSTVWEVARPS